MMKRPDCQLLAFHCAFLSLENEIG